MADNEYVPDHEIVREAWAHWCASVGIGRATAFDEFERFVSCIQAEAWDEGYDTGGNDVGSGWRPEELTKNPYKKEDK